MRKVIERLLNLLAFLLTTSRPVTADEIRRRVAGYGSGSDEAFRRMFERDKDLLRGIGIPLELTDTDGWGIDHGYVIDPERYRIDDPNFTDEERAALSLAGRVVRLGGHAAPDEALFKLGGTGHNGGVEPLGADLGMAADVLGDLFAAVSDRRVVSFDYRDSRRQVSPFGLAHRRGHWYLSGGTKQGNRIFRVDRLSELTVGGTPDAFERPAGFDLRSEMEEHPWESGSDEKVVATVEFDPEVAWWAARTLRVHHDSGTLRVELPVVNVDAFIGWLFSFDDGAVVVAPRELRDQIVARVRAASG